jgi:hypothetical protein
LSAATNNLLETLDIVSPLGLRFWDQVGGKAIGDGLSVYAYPADNELWRTPGFTNRGDVYAFDHLPGLRPVENGDGTDAFWAQNPPQFPFVIEVKDLWRRFLPFSVRIHLPVRGVWEWNCEQFGSPSSMPEVFASPPEPKPRGIPLFPTPASNAPAGMAMVRASVREAVDPSSKPAAWALLQASVSGKRVARGIADEEGRVVMIFPYPDPAEFSPGSPATRQRSLRDQSWELEISAFYVRKDPSVKIHNLCDLLNQPPAVLWDDAARTKPLSSKTLQYGEELTLKSASLSDLLISVAGSPQ